MITQRDIPTEETSGRRPPLPLSEERQLLGVSSTGSPSGCRFPSGQTQLMLTHAPRRRFCELRVLTHQDVEVGSVRRISLELLPDIASKIRHRESD